MFYLEEGGNWTNDMAHGSYNDHQTQAFILRYWYSCLLQMSNFGILIKHLRLLDSIIPAKYDNYLTTDQDDALKMRTTKLETPAHQNWASTLSDEKNQRT